MPIEIEDGQVQKKDSPSQEQQEYQEKEPPEIAQESYEEREERERLESEYHEDKDMDELIEMAGDPTEYIKENQPPDEGKTRGYSVEEIAEDLLPRDDDRHNRLLKKVIPELALPGGMDQDDKMEWAKKQFITKIEYELEYHMEEGDVEVEERKGQKYYIPAED